MRNWIALESRENAADGLGLELVSPQAVGREEETWHGEPACVRNGGPCRAPSTGSWRSPPHCQMPDEARAAVWAARVAFGPFWEAAAHALGVQKLYCNSGCSGGRGRFERIRHLLILLSSHAEQASHSPRIIVSDSQSHQEAH